MKRLLLLLIAALALPVQAGIPEKFQNKWMVLLDNEVNTWIMNTEDIDISGGIIRFWVQEFDKENSTG